MSEIRVIDTAAVPAQPGATPGLTVRPTFGPDTGMALLEQAILECADGPCGPIEIGEVEETLYVVSGSGRLTVRGSEHEVAAGCGVCLPRASTFSLDVTGTEPLRLVAVRLLDPAPGPPSPPQVSRVADRAAQPATADREFRVLAGPDTGLRSATHFVGAIPPGRAPDHFHTYDELLYVLEGSGALHGAGLDAAVGPGWCVQLPARAVHCLENTGTEPMRVVAVFRPAGSPAAAFYPDGTPAVRDA